MLSKRSFHPTRRSPRQWLNTSVRVFAGPAHFDALGVNLSEGGMCLFTIGNLPVGSELEVEFLPPRSSEPVRFSGKVRHRALYLYGIEFVEELQDAAFRVEQCALDPS
jgi:PilZ domain